MRILISILALALAALPLSAANLQIYFIDVEGGQATLIVSPSGESMLVDAGWPGFNGRDADRIAAAAKLAGVKQIDYMLMTHYHTDHVGGVPEVAAKIPIIHYVDHGSNTEANPGAQKLAAAYEEVAAKGKRRVVKPGDKIPLKGVEISVVAARGATISAPLPGAGASNPACASIEPKREDRSENARSVGFILKYGNFRFADLADLTWNKENELVCPNNRIGTADVYLISHHGLDISNSPAILSALQPIVAIGNNGADKGGAPGAFKVIRNTPSVKDVWQLHTALAAGDLNAPEQFIANPEENCQGHYIKLTAESDGTFTITNSRNNFSKTYKR
ncbi:MAG: ComEC/Rec2 family competence protein [Rhodospirillales bacterium]